MTHYQKYQAAYDAGRAALTFPADCTVKAPTFKPFMDFINPRSWQFEWFLTFSDEHYIVCREVWSFKVGKNPERSYYSYHYGPIVARDSKGNITRDSDNPLIIRICKDNRPGEKWHLHYRDPHPAPHYTQSQIDGLNMDKADMFKFIDAVFKCRANKVEMHEAMGFTIRETR